MPDKAELHFYYWISSINPVKQFSAMIRTKSQVFVYKTPLTF